MEASELFVFKKLAVRIAKVNGINERGESPTFNGSPRKWAKSFQATFNTNKKDNKQFVYAIPLRSPFLHLTPSLSFRELSAKLFPHGVKCKAKASTYFKFSIVFGFPLFHFPLLLTPPLLFLLFKSSLFNYATCNELFIHSTHTHYLYKKKPRSPSGSHTCRHYLSGISLLF